MFKELRSCSSHLHKKKDEYTKKKKKKTVPFLGPSSALSSQVNLYLQTKQTKAPRKSQPRSAYLQHKSLGHYKIYSKN